MQAASSRIRTSRSSNCSRTSSQSDFPAGRYGKYKGTRHREEEKEQRNSNEKKQMGGHGTAHLPQLAILKDKRRGNTSSPSSSNHCSRRVSHGRFENVVQDPAGDDSSLPLGPHLSLFFFSCSQLRPVDSFTAKKAKTSSTVLV